MLWSGKAGARETAQMCISIAGGLLRKGLTASAQRLPDGRTGYGPQFMAWTLLAEQYHPGTRLSLTRPIDTA